MTLRKSLQDNWLSIAVATLLTLLLAAASSGIGVLIGPSLRLLLAGADSYAAWTDLLGPTLGAGMERVAGVPGLKSADLWHVIPRWLFALASIKALCSLVQWYLWERTSERVARDIRRGIMERFIRLDPETRSEGDMDGENRIASALSTDIKYVQEFVVRYYGGLPREAVMLFFYILTLWALSPRLLTIFLFAVLPTVLLVGRIGKRLRRRASDALQNVSEVTEWLQQRLMGFETIKFYRQESAESEQLTILNQGLFRRHEAAARVKSRTGPVMEVSAVIAMALVFWLSSREIQLGTTSPSACLSFFATLGLLSQAAGKLGKYVNVSKEGQVAMGRLCQLQSYLEAGSRQQVAAPVVFSENSKRSSLCFKDVSYRYGRDQQWALRRISCRLDGGKIYAACGASGAGKSTMMRLILGLATPNEGELLLNVDGKRPSLGYQRVGYVPQQIELFPGSLAENIAFPRVDFEADRVEKIIYRLGLQAVGGQESSSPDASLDQTSRLSGGQAQRVLLGRMFYHQPRIVLIDEGTSALDPETEDVIHQGLRALAADGAVVLVISHRRASLKIADEVLFLEAGQLAFQGAVSAAEQQPAFRRLFAISET